MNTEIIPPPEDIEKLILKTAEFVAKSGSAMETKIWESQKTNPKFSFLKHGDLYRPFYEQKVFEFVEKFEVEEEESDQEPEVEVNEVKTHEPSPFCLKHPVIAKVDMDIIKLTALFTAKNGRNFWMGLSERESQNPQFSFLKPNHALFSYFMSLVDSYSRCLVPKLEDIKTLQQNLLDPESILQECLERFSLEKSQDKNQKSREEAEDEERQQMSMIDWHDFVVVETIEFNDEEALPMPNDPTTVQTMSLPLMRDSTPTPAPNPTLSPNPPPGKVDSGAIIEENYSQRCPVCRDMIPVKDFQEHIRLELIDPKYKQTRENLKTSSSANVFASGNEVYKNLQNLAKQRPDLISEDKRAEGSRVSADPIMEKTKKRPNEEFLPNLVPEKQWAQMHPGPVAVHVQIPDESENEKWNFNGQILQISVDIRSTVLDIKNKLSEILGMPVSKMKFKNITHSVMKDSNSLAYYNVIPASIIELVRKERGGRRKH